MHIEETLEIEITPKSLWPLLVESEKMQRWMPSVEKDEPITEGPPGVGSMSRVSIREGARLVDYVSEVKVFEPPTKLEVELRDGSLGANPMRLVYTMAPSRNGTSVHYTADWMPKGLMLTLMTPFIRMMAARNTRNALAKLKSVAESNF